MIEYKICPFPNCDYIGFMDDENCLDFTCNKC